MWWGPDLKNYLVTKLGSAHYGNQPKTEMVAWSIARDGQHDIAKDGQANTCPSTRKWARPMRFSSPQPSVGIRRWHAEIGRSKPFADPALFNTTSFSSSPLLDLHRTRAKSEAKVAAAGAAKAAVPAGPIARARVHPRVSAPSLSRFVAVFLI
jgi:hypothetical protein